MFSAAGRWVMRWSDCSRTSILKRGSPHLGRALKPAQRDFSTARSRLFLGAARSPLRQIEQKDLRCCLGGQRDGRFARKSGAVSGAKALIDQENPTFHYVEPRT